MEPMTKEYSPFTPGVPAPKELFIGREREIEQLRAKVAASLKGRLQIGFLSGGRGIGKSSLAAFVKSLVEIDLRVLGLHAYLGGVSSLEEMTQRVFDRLLKDSTEKIWYEKVKGFLGNHIKQIGAYGFSVEFNASKGELQHLVRNFGFALRNLLKQLKGEKESLFIILDDINGLATSAEFANWFKSFVDEIATDSEPLPLCLLVVGYEERRQSLIKLQPSIARIFELFEVPAWNEEETGCFYRNALSRVDITIEDTALQEMVNYSGGIPVLAHEIGNAVFKEDQDNYIDNDDASKGIKSAAEIIGRKFLETQVIQAIQKSSYQSIMNKLVHHLDIDFIDSQFTRGNFLSVLNEKERNNFNNFIRWMTKNGVLVRTEKGEYKFANSLYAIYCYMRSS
jgi:AAA+ ATPase superfamily predicted ATPase